MSQLDTLESNIAKPSWCFDVMVMYFIPAAFTIATHSAASNCSGLKNAGSFS